MPGELELMVVVNLAYQAGWWGLRVTKRKHAESQHRLRAHAALAVASAAQAAKEQAGHPEPPDPYWLASRMGSAPVMVECSQNHRELLDWTTDTSAPASLRGTLAVAGIWHLVTHAIHPSGHGSERGSSSPDLALLLRERAEVLLPTDAQVLRHVADSWIALLHHDPATAYRWASHAVAAGRSTPRHANATALATKSLCAAAIGNQEEAHRLREHARQVNPGCTLLKVELPLVDNRRGRSG